MVWGGLEGAGGMVGLREGGSGGAWGGQAGPGGLRGPWGSGRAGGAEGPGPPRSVSSRRCPFGSPGEGVRVRPGSRQPPPLIPPSPRPVWGRGGGRDGVGSPPVVSPGPAPCPGLPVEPEPRRMLAPLYVAFLSPEGLGSVYLGKGTVLNLVFKIVFSFSLAKLVRMNLRNRKNTLLLLPPPDRS